MGIADRKERIRETAPPALLRYLKQDRYDRKLIFRNGILEWAEENGIGALWERQVEFGRKIIPALEEASNAFLNPHSRTVLGTMLLAESPFDEIVDVMQRQFSVAIDQDIVGYFKSLFWDTEAMGRTDWDRFLEDLNDEQRPVIALGARGMDTGDIRYAIGAESPSSPDDVLQDILTHAHRQFKQAMSSIHPEASGAFKWADLATKVANSISKQTNFVATEKDDQPHGYDVAENMFSVVIEKPRIITLDDLQGEVSQNKTALDRAMEENARDS